MPNQSKILFMTAALLGLSACMGPRDVTTLPPRLAPASFADMAPYKTDTDLSGFKTAMLRSCELFAKRPANTVMKPAGTAGEWRPFCDDLSRADNAEIKGVIETHLAPYRVTLSGRNDGLFTGYYEPTLRASRTKGGIYQTPVRGRPLDHVVVDAGAFRPDLKGVRLTGQLTGTPGTYTLVPYPDRAGIGKGKIPPDADRVLAWAADPADVFFLEIQGSGKLLMEDGSIMHVGYHERNGQKYTALGKVMADKGLIPKDQVSMQTIKAYLSAHPDQAPALMNENASAVFFREITGDGPIGASGLALIPGRSLAVDPRFWSYGLPVFIDAENPARMPNGPRFSKLMVAQDTGGAIRGAIRGDVFLGDGADAAHTAGLMQSRGMMWILLPRTVQVP